MNAGELAQAIRYTIDLKDNLVQQTMRGKLVKNDRAANKVVVSVVDGKEEVDLSGVAVTGGFIRPGDSAEILLSGSADGNEASVTLEDACYEQAGTIEIFIRLSLGGILRTILTLTGDVIPKGSGAYVDITGAIPSIEDIIAQYAEMQAVTQRTIAAAQRAENLAIDASGLAGDANRLGGKPPEYYTHPRDQLDNSDFINAVNQRGKTSFADSGYFIDRWRTSVTGTLGALHFSISDDEGLKIVSTIDGYVDIFQRMEQYARLKGKTFTFAAKIKYQNQETVVAKTFTLGNLHNAAKLTDDGNARLYSIDGLNICIRLHGNNGTANELTIRWAALYEGAYTVDTLPPYMPKGYAEELAACQYYATVIEAPVNSRIGIIRAGSSNGILLLNVPTMRKGVVPSFSALSGSAGDLVLDNSEVYGATITTYGPVVGNTVNAILNFASNNSKPNTIDSVRNAGTETFKLLISVDL